MEKYGFFEDNKGNKSSTRLMTFMALVTGLLIAICSLILDEVTLGDSLPLVLTLLGYSLGAKSFQNVIEKKGKP